MQTFFQNKKVLVTGVTGFVGKALLEKLLYSTSEISTIYVIVRPTSHVTAEERFQKEVLQSQIFKRLKEKISGKKGAGSPNQAQNEVQLFYSYIKQKVKVISGDLLLEDLGLKPEHREEIIQSVNIIYHVAASVDFNQRLDQAIQINTLGPIRMLELGKQCRQLQCFVDVSTAYVNVDKQGWVEEKIYSFPFEPRNLIKNVMQMKDKELENNTAKILGNFPNTYTFTKAMGEILITQNKGQVNLVIIRPSIIGAAWKYPMPG